MDAPWPQTLQQNNASNDENQTITKPTNYTPCFLGMERTTEVVEVMVAFSADDGVAAIIDDNRSIDGSAAAASAEADTVGASLLDS
jgi:hypothetical protein